MRERDVKKEIADWMVRIDLAKVVRKREEDIWEKNYRAVYGDDWIGPQDVKSRIQTNASKATKYTYDKLLAFLKTEIPGLVTNIPEAFINISDEVESQKPGTQQVAEIIQGRLNTILSDMDGLDIDTRVMLADAHCALMIAKVVRVNKITKSSNAGQVAYVDPETGVPMPFPDDKSDPDYDILRIDPFRFLIDERCQNNPKRALWVGEEIPKTLAEIKTERLYDEEIIDKVEDKVKEKVGKDLRDWEINLTIYEIYDKYEDKLYVICDEYPDAFLRDEAVPEGIEHNPYVIRKLCEIPGQFYGKPEISSGRILQDDFKEGRDWQRRRAKKSNPQLGIAKTFSESLPAEVKKVGDGISDYVIVNKESDTFPLNKETQNQSPAITEHMAQIGKDFDETMGQSSMSRGLVGESKFATEAEISQLKGDQRKNDKQMQIKIFWGMIIEKLLMLIGTNKSEDPEIVQALQVINPDLDIEINVEDRSPRNMAIDRKQMIEAASAYPALQQSPTFIKHLLKTFDIRDQGKILSEIEQVMQAQLQASQPQAAVVPSNEPSVSISFKGELIPTDTANAILDTAFNKDIPYSGAVQPTLPGNVGRQEIAPNESPNAGTESMSPGSGMMPSGEVI